MKFTCNVSKIQSPQHLRTSRIEKAYFKAKIKIKKLLVMKLWNVFLHLTVSQLYKKPRQQHPLLVCSRFVFYSKRISQIEVQVASHSSTSPDASIAFPHHCSKFLVVDSTILKGKRYRTEQQSEYSGLENVFCSAFGRRDVISPERKTNRLYPSSLRYGWNEQFFIQEQMQKQIYYQHRYPFYVQPLH